MTVTINGTTGIAGTNGSASTPAVQGEDTNTGIFFPAADTVAVATGGTEQLRVDSSGNVGIGTSSPASELDIKSANPTLTLTDSDDNGYSRIRHNTGSLIFEADQGSTTAASAIRFDVDGVEAARIDSSWNVLVGKTSAATGTVGAELRANGKIVGTMDGGNHTLNRLTSDGAIVEFQKDTTTVGSIGSIGDDIFIDGSGSNGSGIRFESSQLRPRRNGSDADNLVDLGALSYRFDDIYATNNVIQTSDRNEKQDIEELSEAERRVAVACKGLLRKYRWKSAVAEKGDAARIHFGIIAQDLQAAFAAEGLDAGRYAMFIHSTWTDEETGEERSRMGVRYSELLAFIIAAL